MNAANLTHGEADAVANWLHSTNMDEIQHEDLAAALVNALCRIGELERRIELLEAATK